ncbi:radical SAM protein [Candidatus Omnitrophota bacterium]
MGKETKNILLINPVPSLWWKYHKDDPNVGPPLGVLSVGSMLRQEGFSVKIIDAAVEKKYSQSIKNELKKELLFVGISTMTPQVPSALYISRLIKEYNSALPIVWGGVHPTLFPEQTLKDATVDIVIRGLGEYAVLEIADALNNGRPFSSIRGIGYKSGGSHFFTEERGFIKDMNTLPSLDYELIDVENYINRNYVEFGGKRVRTLMIYGGIGCPYKCRFCISSIVHHSRYAFKSAQKLIREIEIVINRYNVNHINFRDENFFASRSRIEELLKEKEERNLKFSWEANVRASYFNESYISEDFLKRLEASGCVLFGIGAESGDDRVLKRIKKDITTDDVLHSCKLSKKYKITFGYSFMMAIPGETKTEMLATAKFILRLIDENKNNYIIGPQIFRPYPGSELYKECLGKGLYQPDDLSGWQDIYFDRDIIVDKKDARERLPWIDDLAFVGKIHFYTKCAALSCKKGNFIERLIRVMISRLSRLRIRHDFFNLPLEYMAYSVFAKLLLRLRSNILHPSNDSEERRHKWTNRRHIDSLEKGFVRHLHAVRTRYILEKISQIKKDRKMPLRILDLGCGDGVITHRIEQVLQGEDELFGCDDDPVRLDRTRQLCSKANFKYTKAERLDFPDICFDLVLLHHVIEHIEDDRAVLRECFRVLKPEGFLILGIPQEDSVFGRILRRLHRGIYKRGEHIHFYSVDSMKRLIEESGFSCKEYKKFGSIFPFYYIHILLIANKLTFSLGNILAQEFDFLADSLIFSAKKTAKKY